MIYLVISVLGMCISGAVASGKNRSGFAWAALGFFLPVIGVVAACCVPQLEAPRGDVPKA